jgi:hypothetical protein
MGKRELLLIAAFVVLGSLVYVATAPDRPEGHTRFSLGKVIDEIRREVRGNQASAELTTNAQHALTPETTEIRVQIRSAQVTIIGETRSDIASELYVWSNGYDEAQAKSLAGETRLKVEPAGPSVLVAIAYPQPGSQRARLKLRVPSHLRLQLEPTDARLEIANVAAIDHESARGETIVRQIPGRVTLAHRGGKLIVADVGPVRLNTRGSDVDLSNVKGEAVLQAQGGEVQCKQLQGPVEIESTSAEIVFDAIGTAHNPIRINATGGTITVRGLRTEARIDGREAEIVVDIDRAAPIAIFNSNEGIEVAPPAGGYQFDAVASSGRITVGDVLKAQLPVRTAENEERVSGKVNGGGATITVRNSGGDIRIVPRTPPAEQKDEK